MSTLALTVTPWIATLPMAEIKAVGAALLIAWIFDPVDALGER